MGNRVSSSGRLASAEEELRQIPPLQETVEELKAAVKAGKLTEKEAIAKWETVRKALGPKDRKPAGDKKGITDRQDAPKGKRSLVALKRLPPKRPAKPKISEEAKSQLEAIKKD